MSFLDPLEYGTGLFSRLRRSLALVALSLAVLFGGVIWLIGSRNPYTPAGYVGYLTRGAVFGKSTFYGIQRDRLRPGATGCSMSPTSASRRTPTRRTSPAKTRF